MRSSANSLGNFNYGENNEKNMGRSAELSALGTPQTLSTLGLGEEAFGREDKGAFSLRI